MRNNYSIIQKLLKPKETKLSINLCNIINWALFKNHTLSKWSISAYINFSNSRWKKYIKLKLSNIT